MNIILVCLLAVVFAFIPILYNLLVSKRNQVENAFATIDVMLKRRFDLIPNLVTVVKQYARHEEETFARIAELRNGTYNDLSDTEKEAFDQTFTRASERLVILAEKYPDLKASDNFMHLQRTLNETEEQLSAARRTFNASVTDYNNAVQTFPSNLIAGMFGFQLKHVFSIPQHEREVPETSFSDKN